MDEKSTSIRMLSAAVALISLVGCATYPEYAVVLQNKGKKQLVEANVQYGKFTSVGGILIPGSRSSHGHVPHAIPKTATVNWRDAETGKAYSKEVKVRELLPWRFSGQIYFIIADDGSVTVKGEAYD